MRLWSTTGIHVVVQWSQRRANVLTTRNATKETLFTVALHTTGGFYQLSCRDGPPTVATIEVLTCLPNERTAIMHGREKRHRGVKPNVWEWFESGSRATLVFSLASVFVLALICLRDHERFSRVQRRSLYAPCLRRLRVVHDWPIVCEISSSSQILQLGQPPSLKWQIDWIFSNETHESWNLICIDDN